MDKIDTAGYTHTRLIPAVPHNAMPTDTLLVIHQGLDMLAQEIIDRQVHLLLGTIYKAHIIGNIRYRVKGVGIVLSQARKPRYYKCLVP